ncbi:DEAD/DEAH box helicase [Novosphingobium mangrovi (ex Hu et al. 2023)]|uniref:DEAD/DEAH box helicase n=1 Tax=Novosphingobium mangrovi (ex Hu et al. 2023) TaxID=2930094 RepID=A0ABT0A8J3_9SPHN|nr:DEAD/DEAH box helicase [Novosphingobium mangrovi (ex Hu et al. 2023)]MCJ1959524.1 DEAD/DEAH box helicase [Novosphingobium mangrovi (ex Hu et al. 2023)]
MSFADLGLSDELLQAVEAAGYSEPTPIQAQAIPPVLMMKDLIGIAQTGTGKTASFVLPMIDVLAHGRRRALMPRSLILEPTRELAAQVADNFVKYGKNHDLRMALLIGGVQMGEQVKALQEGVDVLIATPGRLMDLFERGKILLTGCELLVIDEADRMLDMGFIPDIETICSKLPTNRQTLLFSATMPPVIKKLADRFLENPKYIEVARPASTNTNIAQFKVPVTARKKRETLREILRTDNVSTAIIFCNRKTTVRELAKNLKQNGFAAGEIHGDMDQSSRIAELDCFKSGEINILVASDVAARGLDVKGVSHVFNYDTPWHPDDYVHRIGRTGRGGASGRAFTLVTPDDAEAVENVEKLTGGTIPLFGEAADSAEAAPAAEEAEAAPAPRKRASRSKTATKTTAAPAKAKPAPKAAAKPAPAPVAEETVEAESPAPAPKRRAPRRRAEPTVAAPVLEAAGDWNGPIPDFLAVSAVS